MNEATGASELDVHLAKAQQLIGRGDQKHALDELWAAEALARGSAEALREILEFATTSGQWFGLASLVDALKRDIWATQPPIAPADAQKRRSFIGRIGRFVTILAGGVGGALLGAKIGVSFAPKPDPNAMIDLSGLPYAIYGLLFGFLAGAIVLPLVVSSFVAAFRMGRAQTTGMPEPSDSPPLSTPEP
jgi:hypothetical protein